MCMINDADGYVLVIRESTPSARKPHKCDECHRVINIRERYLREYMKFDGDMSDHKTCMHCQIARDWLLHECAGFCYGEIEEDIVAHAQDGYGGIPLMRTAIGMRRKWTRRDGRLMALPRP